MGLMGVVGLALGLAQGRVDAFSTRGDGSGNGAASLLYWAAAAYVAYVVVSWVPRNSRAFPVVAALMVGGLFLTGNRSPLALIGIAVIVRIVWEKRGALFALAGLAVPLGLAVFAYQSAWRSLVARGYPSGFSDVIALLLSNPLSEFLRLGLDSIDGHLLSTVIVARGYEARWLDPFLAVTNFIPRQLWAEKPNLLGSEIGASYLGVTHGGIFLSGPGYMALVTGSVALGAATYILLMLAIKRLASAPRVPLILVCALVTLVARFSIAGDAFDIFLAVQVAVIFAIGSLASKLIRGRTLTPAN
jgi:hypothetical protein